MEDHQSGLAGLIYLPAGILQNVPGNRRRFEEDSDGLSKIKQSQSGTGAQDEIRFRPGLSIVQRNHSGLIEQQTNTVVLDLSFPSNFQQPGVEEPQGVACWREIPASSGFHQMKLQDTQYLGLLVPEQRL